MRTLDLGTLGQLILDHYIEIIESTGYIEARPNNTGQTEKYSLDEVIPVSQAHMYLAGFIRIQYEFGTHYINPKYIRRFKPDYEKYTEVNRTVVYFTTNDLTVVKLDYKKFNELLVDFYSYVR